jgi:hypothetical protein
MWRPSDEIACKVTMVGSPGTAVFFPSVAQSLTYGNMKTLLITIKVIMVILLNVKFSMPTSLRHKRGVVCTSTHS